MRIPSEKENQGYERLAFYSEVRDACFYSRDKRVEQYDRLKHYYIYGCSQEAGATPYNKINPVVDTLTAFLYSADSTRFSVHLPPEAPAFEWDKAPVIGKAVNAEWLASGFDQVFGQAIEWALVYNTMLVKDVPKGGSQTPYLVDPHCFGVYREDVCGLDRQEAFGHTYHITKSQLEFEISKHTRREKILAQLTPKPIRHRDEMPEGLRRILVSQQATAAFGPLSPGQTVTGQGQLFMGEQIDYTPGLGVEMVEMTDLYIRDDEKDGDYQIVTMAEGNVVIYDRPNFFVPGDNPFTQVCPSPMHGYFWGASFVAKLIGLQGWRNIRVDEIMRILALQAKPPTSLTGFTGIVDETDFALNSPGGVLNNNDPMGKVERHDIKVPDDLWRDVGNIDEMFMESAGLSPLLMGRGEQGVRSGRQTSELSRLGSSRTKKQAVRTEDALETLATKMFKAMRRFDKTEYMTKPVEKGEKPEKFLLAQCPDDAVIKVDAHSNSPLFVEDQKQLAGELLEVHAIDRESFIEMLNPPMKDVLLRKLPAIEKAEAEAAAKKAQHEEQMQAAKHAPPGTGGANVIPMKG